MVYFDPASHRERKIRLIITHGETHMVLENPLREWKEFFEMNGVKYNDYNEVVKFMSEAIREE